MSKVFDGAVNGSDNIKDKPVMRLQAAQFFCRSLKGSMCSNKFVVNEVYNALSGFLSVWLVVLVSTPMYFRESSAWLVILCSHMGGPQDEHCRWL